ncbi:MAG: hypothetical protein WD295_03235 [Bacteroidota bacterium]
MPALETFDWFKSQVWSQLDDEHRRFIDRQRSYLFTIRNENERRRFVEELMNEIKGSNRKRK